MLKLLDLHYFPQLPKYEDFHSITFQIKETLLYGSPIKYDIFKRTYERKLQITEI